MCIRDWAGETEVDLYGALLEVRDLLGEWGGHRKAAGLTVTPGNLEAFTGRVNAAVRRQRAVDPEIFEPAVEVDAEVALEMVDDDLLGWHERLAPFGSGNYRPVFAAGGLRIERSRQLWEGMNLLTLRGGLRARLACDPEGLPEGSFDAVFTVYRSRYTGVAEMEIVDWRR